MLYFSTDNMSDAPLPPGATAPSSKPIPKSAAAGLLEHGSDKKKFDSADWAKEMAKKDKKG